MTMTGNHSPLENVVGSENVIGTKNIVGSENIVESNIIIVNESLNRDHSAILMPVKLLFNIIKSILKMALTIISDPGAVAILYAIGWIVISVFSHCVNVIRDANQNPWKNEGHYRAAMSEHWVGIHRFAITKEAVSSRNYELMMLNYRPRVVNGTANSDVYVSTRCAGKPMRFAACVDWFEAIGFANKLSISEHKEPCYEVLHDKVLWKGLSCGGYRLPTPEELNGISVPPLRTNSEDAPRGEWMWVTDGDILSDDSLPSGVHIGEEYSGYDPKKRAPRLGFRLALTLPTKPQVHHGSFPGCGGSAARIEAKEYLSGPKQAEEKCHKVCERHLRIWNRRYSTTVPGKMSVCECELPKPMKQELSINQTSVNIAGLCRTSCAQNKQQWDDDYLPHIIHGVVTCECAPPVHDVAVEAGEFTEEAMINKCYTACADIQMYSNGRYWRTWGSEMSVCHCYCPDSQNRVEQTSTRSSLKEKKN